MKDETMRGFKTILSAGFLASALVLAGCGGGGESGPTEEEMAAMEAAKEAEKQKMEADMAISAAVDAAMALVPTMATEEQVMAVEALISTANTEIMDLPEADRSAAMDMLAAAQNIVTTQNARLAAAAEAERLAQEKADKEAMEAAEAEKERMEEEAAKARAMAATAAKLYAGINAPTVENSADPAMHAAYTGTGDSQVTVTFGPSGSSTTAILSEDKKTVVAALQDWAGKRYADPAGGDMVEAMVYSNVGEPKMGAKFNSGTANVGFNLDGTSGETPALNIITGYDARVDSPSFDQSAGTKEFKLPANTVRVMLSGTYYGVSGTYYCTPAAESTCASQRTADGFALGSTLDSSNAFTAGGWTFKPADPEARVMSAPDSNYASYGWWIHKSADDKTYTASAFHDFKGTDPTVDLPEAGTATYSGGAAGKYALSSSTGGTNDAGHFTASATLNAEFGADAANTISGTIDNFVGADGESRDWSVKLNETDITDAGVIDGLGGAGDTAVGTVWTIGGEAAAKSGSWSGNLREMGDNNVPDVATGTFHTQYGHGNSMVGAFGANAE